jgi:two-component system LytT family response regulator
MDTLKIVIADDNESSRTLLRHYIHLLPHYEVIGEAADGEEFVQVVLDKKPDLVLVDINMPNLDGMEAVKLCRELLPNLQIIFTTGYDEFAVEAFNIAAADYIVKPIERTRLFHALEKARKLVQLSSHRQELSLEEKKTIFEIKSQNSILFLPMQEILFIERERRKTVIHTRNEKYETTESLNEVASRLDSYFFKTHRSYIVNLKQIFKIEADGETYRVHFFNSDKVAYISKLKINEVQKSISNIYKKNLA